MKSIIQTEKECYLCRKLHNSQNLNQLEEHHVFFGTANRKLSERYGLKVWLCKAHHTASGGAVHMNKMADLLVKCSAQEVFEQEHTRKDFMSIFGRNYL